jgi:hypothetical protein
LPGEQGPLEIEGDFDFDLDLDFDLEGILLFLSFLFYKNLRKHIVFLILHKLNIFFQKELCI